MRTAATLWLSMLVYPPAIAFAQGPAKDPETLARQVLAAFAAKDGKALESLSIGPAEAARYIWPTVAVRMSGGQMTAAKFSEIYIASSRAALAEDLTEHGGKKLELIRITTSPAKQYKGFRLLPNPELTVRGERGEEQTLKLGSALLERDGVFRIASYYRAPARSGR